MCIKERRCHVVRWQESTNITSETILRHTHHGGIFSCVGKRKKLREKNRDETTFTFLNVVKTIIATLWSKADSKPRRESRLPPLGVDKVAPSLKKSSSTSFWVRTAHKSGLKYTTSVCNKIKLIRHARRGRGCFNCVTHSLESKVKESC